MSEPPTTDRKPRRRAALLFAALGALILAGAFAYWRVHSFNLRDVIPGEIYRVAQPGIDDIERAVTSMGLRSIVNLRGPNMRSAWYRDEVEVSRRLDVELVSLRFETFDWPPRLETLQFVDAIDRVPRPLLIHCHSGLDRSGWAAGVVRLLRGDSVDAARGELSLLEGHFCDRDECALHRFFDLYDEWLARKGRAHSPAAFREWLEGSYYPPPYAAAISSRGAVPVSAIAGTPVSFVVDVTNRSGSGWVATSDKQHGIRLGARILGPFDPAPADPIELFRVPHTPARDLFRDGKSDGVWSAGSSKEIEVGLTAPDTPGLYFIQVDMVDEMVHWFSDLGDAGLILPLRVEPAPAESRIQN